jgi:hypothetical protein
VDIAIDFWIEEGRDYIQVVDFPIEFGGLAEWVSERGKLPNWGIRFLEVYFLDLRISFDH